MLTDEGGTKTYRVAYAVHRLIDATSGSGEGEPPQLAEQATKSTEFIGLVTLKSLDAANLPLPAHLTFPSTAAPTTLTLEVAYMFLPSGWDKGYATEAVDAAFEACKRARAFWTPFAKLYVRAIVNEENATNLRVMEKKGMRMRGVYEWEGKAVWLGGRWRERDRLCIFGGYLAE